MNGLTPMENWRRLAVASALVLIALLAWDAAGLDVRLAALAGDSHGFALRNDWWLSAVLHSKARLLSWAIALGLCLAVWWPVGPLRRLEPAARFQLALTPLVAAAAIVLLKSFSLTSCPWDLVPFGGVARYVPHWALGQADGGAGHCFPAGHAAAGFSFIGGYFVYRQIDRRLAWAWLGAAVVAGLLLGGVQQLRGAHFMSHTLWTGFTCWMVAWALDGAWRAWPRRDDVFKTTTA